MFLRKTLILLALCLTWLLPACNEDPAYPLEPVIEYVSFTKIQNNTGIDEQGVLRFSFTDGDGDIGLSDYDTEPPFDTSSIYYYNCFVTFYEIQHGDTVQAELPPGMTNNYRIPLTPPAIDGLPLQGDIDVVLMINNYSPYDTMFYTVFIVDRALHHSNTITTPQFIIKKH
jgi:hypothetical protein